MRIDHPTLPAQTSAVAAPSATAPALGSSAVYIPYNAPGATQFDQILHAVSSAPLAGQPLPATTPGATPLNGMGLPSTGTAPGSAAAGCCCCCGGMHDTSATAGGMTAADMAATGMAATGVAPASSMAPGSPASASMQLPFTSAMDMTQPFGTTSYTAEPAYDGYSHFHTGLDFALPLRTPIGAASAGRVVAAGWDTTGFGNRVVIDHGNGVETLYGHLTSVAVTPGQTVQAGQQIGLSGSTGNSSGPHLHFGVEQNGQWVDPAPYLGLSANGTAAAAPTAAALTPLSGSAAPMSGGIPLPSPAGAIGGGAADTASGMTALLPLIQRVSLATGVSGRLIAAVVQAESGGDPRAVSPAGAKGLMQLMDPTAASYGVSNAFDPQQNLVGGTMYLRSLLQRYHGDESLALAAYNAGPGAVDQYGGIPPYPETQQYVQRVTGYEQQY